MMRPYTTYVPDSIWHDKNVDHYVYDDKNNIATAYYKDGSTYTWDSTVTPEREQEYHETEYQKYNRNNSEYGKVLWKGYLTITQPKFNRQIVGIVD